MAQIQKVKRRSRTLRRSVIGIVVVGAIVGIVYGLAGGSAKPTATGTSTSTTGSTSTSTTSSATTTTLPKYTTGPTLPPSDCPPASGATSRKTTFPDPPAWCISLGDTYTATFVTDVGTFVVALDTKGSPAAVNNFVFLARWHFFDGTTFPRVIPGFVVQGGSPNDTTAGSPGYAWTGNTPTPPCNATHDCYAPGAFALANSSGPSTNGSQFFIVLPGGSTTLNSEPNYTVFGQVTGNGMTVVDKIGKDGTQSGTPKVTHHIVKVTIAQIPG